MHRVVWLCLCVLGCTDSKDAGSPDGSDGSGSADDSGSAGDSGSADDSDSGDDPAVPVYSQGSCPTLEAGRVSDFAHVGGSHDLRLLLPDEPAGAPVLFAWHWLGGTADQIVSSMELDQLVADEGLIVVAPYSAGSSYEWEFLLPPEDNPDIAVFVDFLACLHEQFEVDLSRIWTTGMSAGGLWTTYLTMHEPGWLAASAPLSGGTFPNTYQSPSTRLPVMVTWGGPRDTYGGSINFEETSLDFSQSLQNDGHFVVECEHDRGHNLPPDATDLVWTFLSAHPKGAPSPWSGGLPVEMPAMCRIPGG